MVLKYTSIAAACLCTIAVVGHPYLQPIEPSNTPDITLLPSENGQINLDGNAFFLLPNGSRKSLQVIDQQLKGVIARFEAKPGNKLLYEYLPTSLTNSVQELLEQTISMKVKLDALESQVAQHDKNINDNSVSLTKIEKMGKIEVVSNRKFTLKDSTGVEATCPGGFTLVGAQCLAEIEYQGSQYWQFQAKWKNVTKVNCEAAWPSEWVIAVAYCMDTGYRKIHSTKQD